MDFFKKIFERAKENWSSMSKSQKILFSGIAASVLTALIVTSILFGGTNYVPLYPELNISESSIISQKLKDLGVKYEISSDGTTILVPEEQMYQLRLDLATELPSGGVVGFESFNEVKFGETETDKRVRFLASLQGEITRTIQQINEVDKAMVHIAIPEPSLFVEDDKPTTASVFLKLKPYAKMNSNQVKSVMYFVSNSVEGLNPENVTIIDEYGNLLSDGIVDSDTSFAIGKLTATQLEIKGQFEKELSNSLERMLEKIKGPGKAVVHTTAVFDFDNVETSREDYGDTSLRSESGSESTSSGSTPTESGVAGTDSNLPGSTSYQSSNQNSESSSSNKEFLKNYEVDKITEHRIKAPGTISQLSISVIVDGEINDEEKNELEKVVASAAGINIDRGDTLNVVGMVFDTSAYEKMQADIDAEVKSQQIQTYVRYGLMLLAVLLIIGAVFFVARKKKTDENLLQKGVNFDSKELADDVDLLEDLSPENLEKIQIQQKVEKLSKTQPEDVAKVIKSWLAEDVR